MISGREIKVLDINSEYYGVPAYSLMENAGKGVSDFINKDLEYKKKKILIISGIGNNGGDGFVAARYLAKNHDITLFLTGKEKDIKTKIAKKNFKKLKQTKNVFVYDIESLKKIDELLTLNDIIIDSMLGIGITGDLREPYQSIANNINRLKNKTILSVDIPTGFGTKTSIKPDYTITFHDIKEKMNKKNSGEIKIVDIKIPKKAIEYIGPGELKTYYPIPKKQSHKGENGRIIIVGGGPFIGAPALSGLAALRTGADLVYIFTPKKVAKAITSFSPFFIKPKKLAKNIAKLSPNLIVKELTNENKVTLDDIPSIEDFIPKCDTLVVGPGLGSDKNTEKAIEKIIEVCLKNKRSLVIDADAIKVIGKKPGLIKNSQTVITPHAGEFKKLTDITLSDKIENRKKTVEKWAKKLGVTILLKGSVDIVSNGSFTKLNDIHNQAMTVGGTGDVLAGLIGALLSKKVNPFNAARIGVFINGSAGNYAFKKRSYGLIATDIIDEIPNILKKYI